MRCHGTKDGYSTDGRFLSVGRRATVARANVGRNAPCGTNRHGIGHCDIGDCRCGVFK